MQNLLKCLPSGNSSTSDPSSFLYLSSIDLPGILSHLPNILTPERKTSIIQHTMCRYFYFLATVVILENQKGKKSHCLHFHSIWNLADSLFPLFSLCWCNLLINLCIICRQSHKAFFDKSDLFFVCLQRPLSYEITKQDSEIEACQVLGTKTPTSNLTIISSKKPTS